MEGGRIFGATHEYTEELRYAPPDGARAMDLLGNKLKASFLLDDIPYDLCGNSGFIYLKTQSKLKHEIVTTNLSVWSESQCEAVTSWQTSSDRASLSRGKCVADDWAGFKGNRTNTQAST